MDSASSKRHYWQLPLFAAGLVAAAAAWSYFPPPPADPAAQFTKNLNALKLANDRKPADPAAVEAALPKILDVIDQFPDQAAFARFQAGTGFVILAEAAPGEQERWAAADAQFQQIDPTKLTDENDQRKFVFRKAKAQSALGIGDTKATEAALLTPPLGEDVDGERRRLLADTCLRMDPPNTRRARDELLNYLSGPNKLPPSDAGRYRIRLADIHLALNEPEKARSQLKEVGSAAPAEVQAQARGMLAKLAASESNWPEAAKLYEAALASGSLPAADRGSMHYQAGLAFQKVNNPAAAMGHFEQALKDPGPSASAAALRLAELILRDATLVGKRTAALRNLELAGRALDSKNPMISIGELAAGFEEAIQVFLKEADFGSAEKASQLYGKVATNNRDRERRADVLLAWGTALQGTSSAEANAKFQMAAGEYRRLGESSLTLAGKADYFRRALQSFKLANDETGAAAVIDQLVSTPGIPEEATVTALIERADSLLAKNQFPEAVLSLQKALSLPAPSAALARVKLATAHLDRAKRLARQGNAPAEAQGLFDFGQKLLVQVASGTTETPAERDAQHTALFELGKLLLQQSNIADAEARFRQLVQTHPTGPLADQARLYLGSCLLLTARGDHQGGAPPADADRKLAEARKLFETLSDSKETFLRTQADIRLANTLLLQKDYDNLAPLCDRLAARYSGKVEELIVLSMQYSAFRTLDRVEQAARSLSRMTELFANLKDSDFPGGAEEYTRSYWQKQWFEPLKGSK